MFSGLTWETRVRHEDRNESEMPEPGLRKTVLMRDLMKRRKEDSSK